MNNKHNDQIQPTKNRYALFCRLIFSVRHLNIIKFS